MADRVGAGLGGPADPHRGVVVHSQPTNRLGGHLEALIGDKAPVGDRLGGIDQFLGNPPTGQQVGKENVVEVIDMFSRRFCSQLVNPHRGEV